MVYNAICHTQLEVRREAADCLMALIHCGFQPLTSSYIVSFFRRPVKLRIVIFKR